MRTLVLLCSLFFIAPAFAAPQAEWTFLLFLNGNNNLDKYGKMNLNQLEKVGSNARINIVVQWASLKNGKVQRYLIQKDHDDQNVTSPVLQNLGEVDMGDWKSLVDFVQWGAKTFPAQHYFVDVWDHGSGWHEFVEQDPEVIFKDISHDDNTGHAMTTKELAMALAESSKAIGHKIEIYGSDACLMAMVEVASEVAPSVDVFVGSQETEPGKGWPYDAFFDHWNRLPVGTSPKEIAKVLTEEYAKSYSFRSNLLSDQVTLSSFDLSVLDELQASIRNLSSSIRSMSDKDNLNLKSIVKDSQDFYNSDYIDFMDFMNNLKAAKIAGLSPKLFEDIDQSTKKFILSNNTMNFPRANGMSIWLPAKRRWFRKYEQLYREMNFDRQTQWSGVLETVVDW